MICPNCHWDDAPSLCALCGHCPDCCYCREDAESDDDQAQAEADAEQDSRELEAEVSRGGWPK